MTRSPISRPHRYYHHRGTIEGGGGGGGGGSIRGDYRRNWSWSARYSCKVESWLWRKPEKIMGTARMSKSPRAPPPLPWKRKKRFTRERSVIARERGSKEKKKYRQTRTCINQDDLSLNWLHEKEVEEEARGLLYRSCGAGAGGRVLVLNGRPTSCPRRRCR